MRDSFARDRTSKLRTILASLALCTVFVVLPVFSAPPLFSLTLFSFTLFSLTALAAATGQEEPVSFETEVWPILENSCVACHGLRERFSNLRLDSPEAILKGGDLGKVLVPGEPDESPLYIRPSLPDDDLDLMPVEGDRLTEEEVETLRRWIAEGADFGDWTGK